MSTGNIMNVGALYTHTVRKCDCLSPCELLIGNKLYTYQISPATEFGICIIILYIYIADRIVHIRSIWHTTV